MSDRITRPARRRFGLVEVHSICSRLKRGHDLKELCAQYQVRESSFWIVWRLFNGWRWHELRRYREMRQEFKRLSRIGRTPSPSPILKVTAGAGKSRGGALVMEIYMLRKENDRLKETITAFTRSSRN